MNFIFNNSITFYIEIMLELSQFVSPDPFNSMNPPFDPPKITGGYQPEQPFRAFFESSAIGMGLLGLDGKILRVNQAVCDISGYSAAELQVRYDRQNIYPTDLDLDREQYAQLLAGQRDSYEVEKRYVRKNGEVFWAWLTTSMVREADHSPAYLVAMIEDIDEQKRTAEHLAEQETAYRSKLEQEVEARTKELTQANLRLEAEIAQRQRAEQPSSARAIRPRSCWRR